MTMQARKNTEHDKKDLAQEIAMCLEAQMRFGDLSVDTRPDESVRVVCELPRAGGYSFGGVVYRVDEIRDNIFLLELTVDNLGHESTLVAQFGGPDHAASRLRGVIEALMLVGDTIGRKLREIGHANADDAIRELGEAVVNGGKRT